MNIMVSCDDNYVFPLLVMLESIFQNNRGVQIDIYLLYCNLNEDSLCKIKKECDKFKQDFHAYKMDIRKFDNISKRSSNVISIPIEAYFRLLTGEIIPKQVKRILYLDPDIIVNKSLSDFYNMDMENHVLAVCEDFGFAIRKVLKRKVYKNLNLNKNYKYFNSGVILFNLEFFRRTYSGEFMMNFLETTELSTLFADQDCLNYLFQGKVKYTDYNKYNCRPFHYMQNRRSNKRIIQRATIIHYGPKPWLANFKGLGGDIFLKYVKEINEHFEIDYAVENKLRISLNNIKLGLTYGLFNMGRKRED